MKSGNFFILIAMLTVLSCSRLSDQQGAAPELAGTDSLDVQFAGGFRAYKSGGFWHLIILDPFPDATQSFKYLLVPKDEPVPAHPDDEQVIRTPVDNMVMTSTTHIPLLDYLDATEVLTGFPNPDYISSPAMRNHIEAGGVRNVGIDKALEPETILDLDPGLIMAYTMSSDLGELERLRKAGIPYMLNGDYLESHPLGRAEWIKVAGMLLEKESQADSIFNKIQTAYLEISEKVLQTTERPAAFSGVVYGDTWFLPGGKNYAARMMEDAGIHYLWSDNPSAGFLELSFEAVLERAQQAALWIGTASFSSLEEMTAAEPRYQAFEAFRNKQVYNYNKRIGETGGNEYLELGYLRPDLILADLVVIAHPEVLPEHTLYFYQALK